MNARDAMAGALPPAGMLVALLTDFTQTPRQQRGDRAVRHPVKGVGTFEFICPRVRLASWHRDALPQRTATVALGLAACVAQAAAWAPVGALAAVLAGPILLLRGREAARTHLAEFYLPLTGAILVVTLAAYVTCMVGGYLLVCGAFV